MPYLIFSAIEHGTRHGWDLKELGKEKILILHWARYMQQFGSDRLWVVRKVWQASDTDRVICLAA